MAQSVWDDDIIRKLQRFLRSGLTAEQIAARLGRGITKNAVIGKLHRLRKAEKHPQKVKQQKPRKEKRRDVKRHPAIVDDIRPPEGSPKRVHRKEVLDPGREVRRADRHVRGDDGKPGGNPEPASDAGLDAPNAGPERRSEDRGNVVLVGKPEENYPPTTLWGLRTKQCRFPRGDHPDYNFCTERQVDGSPYCLRHSVVCGVVKEH